MTLVQDPSITPRDQGTPFGEYLLMERIGSGGMAELFKAKRPGPEGFTKVVVLKRILPTFLENRSFVHMLIEEAKLCAALQHSNIVQVFDLGEAEGRPFIAMEFVDGMDLLQLLKLCSRKSIPMPPELALFIASEVARGLDYAHDAVDVDGNPLHLIHRDVSPSNVLLSRDGEVKVTDFGVARFSVDRGPVTRAGVLKGKMGYMSPEQVRGDLFDRRADLFSLGIVLFETLTLKRLFLADTDLATLINIRDAKLEQRLERHSYLQDSIQDLLRKALSKSPEERFQTGLEFYRAIQDVLHFEGYRVDSTVLADFVRGRLTELEEESDGSESDRERLTDQELREEPTWVEGASAALESGPDQTRVARPQIGPSIRVEESQENTLHEVSEPTVIRSSGWLVEKLCRWVHERATGVIRLRDSDKYLALYLAGGLLRQVHYQEDEHPLGVFLQEKELVTSQQWERVESLVGESNMRVAEALIQLDFLRADEVIRQLQRVFEEAFLDAFTWIQGTVVFDRGARLSLEDRVPVELDAAKWLTAGIQHGLGREGLLDWLAEHGEREMARDASPAVPRRLSTREKRVLQVLDTSPQLKVAVAGKSESEKILTLRVAFLLQTLEMLRIR